MREGERASERTSVSEAASGAGHVTSWHVRPGQASILSCNTHRCDLSWIVTIGFAVAEYDTIHPCARAAYLLFDFSALVGAELTLYFSVPFRFVPFRSMPRISPARCPTCSRAPPRRGGVDTRRAFRVRFRFRFRFSHPLPARPPRRVGIGVRCNGGRFGYGTIIGAAIGDRRGG